MMNESATIMSVADVDASLAYYHDKLGFDVAFRYGTPMTYAGVCSGGVTLHLAVAKQGKRLPGHGAVSIFVDNVDELHADLVKRGARVVAPPQNYDYGVRDFNVFDLDGNLIVFGQFTGKE